MVKTNEPQPTQVQARPRCAMSLVTERIRDDASGLEGPANSTRGASG